VIRIVICDDHAIVRRGLKELFEAEPDMQVVAEAGDSRELLDRLAQQPCDVLVLDITMPGRAGLDVLPQLRARHEGLRVLMVTMHPEEQFALRALRSGASGYLTKDSAPEDLLRAVRRIAQGGRYISETLADRLADEVQGGGPAQPAHERLSEREFEVLRGIASGRTVGEIASALFLSSNTVSSYRARLLQKLGLRSNAELMHYAITNRLVD